MKLPVVYKELTSSERYEVRKEYINLQNNKCMYCGRDLNDFPPQSVTSKQINWKLFPPNFQKYPIHLQHDHDSGLTEGVVHMYCNAVMWVYHGR